MRGMERDGREEKNGKIRMEWVDEKVGMRRMKEWDKVGMRRIRGYDKFGMRRMRGYDKFGMR